MTPTSLGECLVLQRGTTYQSALLDQPGPVLLGLGSIERNGGFRSAKLRTYGGGSPDKITLGPGDLYVALKDVTQSGDLLGAVARVPPAVLAGRLTQDTLKLDVSSRRVSPSYLYWLLRTPQYRAYCRSHSMGTTNLSLSRNDFLAFLVPAESRDRLALTEVLEALEHKIDRNRRLAAVLEEIAAAEFRARFVDLIGVENQTVETESGRVPLGWTVTRVGDALNVVGGGTPSTKEPRYWEGGTHCWATPKDLSGARSPVLLNTTRHITDEGLSRVSSGLLPERTVLLSSRAPVGYTAMSMVDVAVNQGFIAIPPSDSVPSEYVLFWLRENMDLIKGHAGGTTFAEISKRAFRPLPISIPPPSILTEFEQSARPTFDFIATLERESQALSDIRDTLLPKLISGEIRVPDTADPDEVIGPAAEDAAAAV